MRVVRNPERGEVSRCQLKHGRLFHRVDRMPCAERRADKVIGTIRRHFQLEVPSNDLSSGSSLRHSQSLVSGQSLTEQ